MPKLLMLYSELKQALMDCGLTDREARRALKTGREVIPPHPHDWHSQRRWLGGDVQRYCQELKALG